MPGPKPRKALILLLSFLICSYFGYSQITPTIISPSLYQITGNSLSIQAQVQSTYAIDSVVASVSGRNVVLVYNAQAGVFKGLLSLAGLSQDTLTLAVTASDVNHNTRTISRKFIYDLPPVITVVEPKSYSVARPEIEVKAKCADSSGHCQMNLVLLNGTTSYPAGSFTDSFTTTLDMSPYQGINMVLNITATDSRGQMTTVGNIQVFVETSPYLTPVFTADNQIADFSGQKVFVMNDSLVSSPRIVDISSAAVTAVPFPGYIPTKDNVHLTPEGAVFGGLISSPSNPGNVASLYDWNNSSLDSIGWFGGLKAAGNYCIWTAPATSLYLRDLTTATNRLLSTTANNVANDVTAGGVVVFRKLTNFIDSIVRYENNSFTTIGDYSGGVSNSDPLTDGKNVVYISMDQQFNASLHVYNGSTNYLLSNNPGGLVSQGANYQINNGYVAYSKKGTTGQFEAWIWDSTGNNSQVSSFAGSSTLDLLNSRGDLTFLNGASRYFFTKSAGIKSISSPLGKSYYQNSAWYVVIGRTLFGLNVNASPDSTEGFSINVKKDSLYSFTKNDFTAHFQTTGSLMSVKISRLPDSGTLKLNGVAVVINQEIPRTSLSNLIYYPGAGFTGTDTISWNGSNGYMYSPASAFILMNAGLAPVVPPVVVPPVTPPPVVLPPVAPRISGLATEYCGNAGAQTIIVTNMPSPADSIIVSAQVDRSPVTVGVDGRLSIQPAALSVGSHVLRVIFSNRGGADTTVSNFNINPAVAPAVKLSSNTQSVSGSSGTVTLTASVLSGGGDRPSYLFSRNRSFSSILQPEGSVNSITLDGSSLQEGNNVFFVRLTTSDTCYVSPYGIDSITIVRTQSGGGLIDPDNPGQPIAIGPNPFAGKLTITGLMTTGSYGITLVDRNGQEIVVQHVQGQQETTLITGRLSGGLYFLRLVNEKKGRLIGSVRLLFAANP